MKYLTFAFSVTLSFLALLPSPAEAACPTDSIQPFVGEWQGNALLLQPQGIPQASSTRDTFSIVDCETFKVSVKYLDAAGNSARSLDFLASHNSNGDMSQFVVNGNISEGSTSTAMTGTIRRIQDGTLLGAFSGAIGGQIAFLNELMNLSALANGERHLIRTVQMFKGQPGGPYLGSRIVNDQILN